MRLALILPLLLWSLICVAETQINKTDKSTVLLIVVQGGKIAGGGTGFIVAPGVIATNNHVADHEKVIVLKSTGPNEKPKALKAEKLWLSPDYDLALLSVDGLVAPPLDLAKILPPKGSKVFAIGYPGVADSMVDYDGIESTVTEGIVGRIVQSPWHEGGPKVGLIQHSAGVNSGNSGGPLIDMCGRVVGINTAKAISQLEKTDSGKVIVNQSEQIFLASSTEMLIAKLQAMGIKPNIDTSECNLKADGSVINSTSAINQHGFITNLGIIGALLLAGGALLLSIKKKEVIRETFTQFQRRSSASGIKPNNDLTGILVQFVGEKSDGRSIKLQSKILPNSSVFIGRDSKNTFLIDDSTVSRQHAKIQFDSTGLKICDLNSTNGTWLNGVRLGENFVRLKPGNTVIFGKVKLTCYGEWS